ncbi:MAG: hypothetical protein IOD12_11750 [Silvanigrellales bacterium]|nr:hypothetical protein [Silvanigrellales bacterium]
MRTLRLLCLTSVCSLACLSFAPAAWAQRKGVKPSSRAPGAAKAPASGAPTPAATSPNTGAAQTEATAPAPIDDAATPTERFRGKSAAVRVNKPISVLAGIGFMPRFGEFFSVAYALNRSVVLEPFVEHGTYSFLGLASTRVRLGARGLFFPGNSFYLSGGLNYEIYTGKQNFLGLEDGTYEGNHQQIEVEAGIGNRWMFNSGFTIGATWVGFSQGVVPIGMTSSGNNLSVEDRKIKDDNLKENAQGTSLHFAKLLLGWSF